MIKEICDICNIEFEKQQRILIKNTVPHQSVANKGQRLEMPKEEGMTL